MKHGMNTGHFYFGKNRTFLNWLDNAGPRLCNSCPFMLWFNP